MVSRFLKILIWVLPYKLKFLDECGLFYLNVSLSLGHSDTVSLVYVLLEGLDPFYDSLFKAEPRWLVFYHFLSCFIGNFF